MLRFGRKLNSRTMMWEFADGSGHPIPDEAMPRAGDHVCALFDAQDAAKVAARPSPLREKQ